VELAKSPFIFSQSENIFIATGCDNFAAVTSSDGSVIGCRSVCDTSRDRVIIVVVLAVAITAAKPQLLQISMRSIQL
jgi:hypothetical protein